MSSSSQVRTGPQRTSSLDPAKTAKLLYKRPKHSSSSSSSTPSLTPAVRDQQLAYNKSAPELHERDDLSIVHHERPTSAPLPPSHSRHHPPLSHRRSSKKMPKQHKLDRIDELDESNPLGIALHHGGPYEAAAKKGPLPEPTTPRAKSPPTVKPEVHIKPTDALPEQSSSGGMSLHLLPGQILPSSILRSYQSQTAAQYSQMQQPDFDPYAQYANIDPAPRLQRNVPPHRAHLPPRHRDRQSTAPHNHHRNMGPRMTLAQPVVPQHIPPVQPQLAMPTPQRPHSQYFEHQQHTSPPQLTVMPPPIPQMAIFPEHDAFGHLPAGVLRMNTPTPPPVEPQRNPLLTPIQSSFDLQVQNGLIRRQSLPAHAPQRAVPERPNPVDAFFRDAAPLPSVASAPTIAPFYQQINDTESLSSSSSSHHTQAPPPSYSSHSHSQNSGFSGSSRLPSSAHTSDRKTPLSRSGSSGSDLDQRPHSHGHSHPSHNATDPRPSQFAQLSVPSTFAQPANDNTDSHYIDHSPQFNPHSLYTQSQRSAQSSNTQLPTPPDESPVYFPAQRELVGYSSREELLRGKQELGWQREEDMGRYEREESAALTHGLPTPESTPSPPQMGRPRKISGPSPILADYMSVDPYSRERDDWGDTRASHGHESSLQHRLSVRGESTWSDMGEMGHEYRPQPRRDPSYGSGQSQNTHPDSAYIQQASSRPKHAPRNLVMPTPLQQHQTKQVAEDLYDEAWNAASSLLLSVHDLSSSPHPTPNTSSYHLPQKPQNRNVLRKRSSGVVVPPPLPAMTSMGSLPPQAKIMGIKEVKEGKIERAPRRLSKRRTDF